ncbi:outer membrane assembly protein AsmA [Martelella alba]|uniref:Outer membrane assembly protein AsmA n=1 Tax=Martelella alba TaxID=2590451 RepID=A0ABY2SKZ7_9HYPH|nr:outer membrane assembly protein AsmA [Martelella alba]TKI05783.1 outer membrane assembly protein AsmA [Martelella alba]
MRRLLTTLVILLAVLLVGVTALVMLINPNEFRHYMVAKVKQRSGYDLVLDGNLRWHVWPQLSILAGRTTLTAPGAKLPVVSAENMRLDVELWPLLSHQLSVKQVMLKGAVITLTPDSAERKPKNAPIAPPAGTLAPELRAGWSYDIASLKLTDSLLVWQKQPNEQINFRDLNLDIEQNGHRQGDITFSSRINRDQRDLTLSLGGKIDMSRYPRQITARLNNVSYQLRGTGFPAGGIKGEGAFSADYSQTNRTLDITNLSLSANDSHITGQASAKLDSIPVYQLDLNAQHLNFDALTGYSADNSAGSGGDAGGSRGSRPIIISAVDDRSPSFLNGFDGQLNLTADQVTYRGLNITDFQARADNRRGHLVVNALDGKMGAGRFSLPGTFDSTGPQPTFTLHPDIHQVALGPLLQAFSLPQTLTGQLSVQGDITGRSLTARDFAENWRGDGRMVLDHARLEGLNISQLIQRAVARSNNGIGAEEQSENYSEVKQLTAQASLRQGNLQLSDLAGESDLLALTGNGTLNLPQRQCDVNLDIRVLKGWQGPPDRVAALINTPIPLRVYGPWDALGYELHVDQLMRRQLEDEIRRRLNDWAQKHQNSTRNKEVQKLLDKL